MVVQVLEGLCITTLGGCTGVRGAVYYYTGWLYRCYMGCVLAHWVVVQVLQGLCITTLGGCTVVTGTVY